MISILRIQEFVKTSLCPYCLNPIIDIVFNRKTNTVDLRHTFNRGTETKMVYGTERECHPYGPSYQECKLSYSEVYKNFNGLDVGEIINLMNNKKCPKCGNTIDLIVVNIKATTKKNSVSLIHILRTTDTYATNYNKCKLTNSEFYDLSI